MKIRSDIDAEVIGLELYELEVTAPRDDFELEIKRAEQAVRTGEVGPIDRARELYRRFGVDPTRVRPSSDSTMMPPARRVPPAAAKSSSRSCSRPSRRLKRGRGRPPGRSTLLGSWSGLGTRNGATCVPRKPAPAAATRPPMLTKWGRSKSSGPSSAAATEPKLGYFTLPDGT